MDKISFVSAHSMYKQLVEKSDDLYNTEHGIFFTKHGPDGGITRYFLTLEQAHAACTAAAKNGWSSWASQINTPPRDFDASAAERALESIYYLPGWVIADKNTFGRQI